MVLEPHDIEQLIIDLYIYCRENPTYKLPMRYIWILSKILNSQMENYPSVTGEEPKGIIVVKPPKKLDK